MEYPDVVYRTTQEKYFAVADEISPPACRKAAGAGRHHVHRKVRAAVRHPQAQGCPPRRPERQIPREGSRNRSAGRTPWHGHHRHQHGRPRHRHPARRQPRLHGAPGPRPQGNTARAVSAAEGAIQPAAGPGMFRFLYNSSQEFEVLGRKSWHARRSRPRSRRQAKSTTPSSPTGGLLHPRHGAA